MHYDRAAVPRSICGVNCAMVAAGTPQVVVLIAIGRVHLKVRLEDCWRQPGIIRPFDLLVDESVKIFSL